MTVEDLRKNFEIITKKDNGKEIYYFKCDEDKLDNIKGKFVLTVYPHQWWGNVIDPNVVVLALNPGYSAGSDELDSIIFGELIEENYKLNMIDGHCYGQFLFGDSGNKNNIPFKYSSISKWWRNVFEDIIPNDIVDNYNKTEINCFNKNVGFFNLVGYQSKRANDINIKCPSKEKIIEHIKQLAEDKKRLFIFVWGKSSWEANGLNINNNYIEVNKRNNKTDKICGQNKKLNIKIKADNDRQLLKNLLLDKKVDENEKKNFLKKYNEKYEG